VDFMLGNKDKIEKGEWVWLNILYRLRPS
jgi:hypothetical protein